MRHVCRVVGLCLAAAVLVPAAAWASTGPYVSLGDSYTSAPLVPFQTGNPPGCGRSTNNYPSDVARAIDPRSFTDVSCGSATTANMTEPQSVPGGGTNPPQFNALAPGEKLVTVGIGGNDAGLIGVAETCAELDLFSPTGTNCKNHYTASGSDPNVAAINATGPKVAAVIQGIHRRAPSSRVLVVGYPDGLPVDGSNCWPVVPLSSGDIAYFNSGNNPVRAAKTNGQLPIRGLPQFEWRNFNPDANTASCTPFEQHPQVVNQDVITSWNNKQAPGFAGGYSSLYRSQLLDDQINHRLQGGAAGQWHRQLRVLDSAIALQIGHCLGHLLDQDEAGVARGWYTHARKAAHAAGNPAYAACAAGFTSWAAQVAGDTRAVFEHMKKLGDPGWFTLGDQDLATHLRRTEALRRESGPSRKLSNAARCGKKASARTSTDPAMRDR